MSSHVDEMTEEQLRTFVNHCAYQMGEGYSRVCFGMHNSDATISKVSKGRAGIISNVTEHQLWEAHGLPVTSTHFCEATEAEERMDEPLSPLGKWLCPVRSLSGDGTVLSMARARTVTRIGEFSTKQLESLHTFPLAFNDVHLGNLGIFEDRVVLIDYGQSNQLEAGVDLNATASLLCKRCNHLIYNSKDRGEDACCTLCVSIERKENPPTAITHTEAARQKEKSK